MKVNKYKSSLLIQRQGGITTILITLLLLVFLFFTALAVDVNHALVNKSRLQNGVDAAALAAAVKVSAGESDAVAEATALSTLTSMFTADGNSEISLPAESISITFSNDPQNFSGTYDSSADTYVRVALTDVPLTSYFLHYFDIDKESGASAVAGPSSTLIYACNIVPIAVCADTVSGANDFLGFEYKTIHELKVADQNSSEMGPGNYQLLDFGSGAATVRTALAGGYEGCVDISNNVDTKPGNTVGPVGQGLNTRFGVYAGGGVSAADYPPDIYVEEPGSLASTDADGNVVYNDTWMYADYLAESASCDGSASGSCTAGEAGRRILPIPMVDCTGAGGGATSLPVTAVGCFFLIQKAPANNGTQDGVYGEFIEDCTVKNGSTGITPNAEGIFKIQLYRDPLSGES
ncbi:pilus assembly protein TadG-related protein [Vibrio parahaemolyticus]|uniref:pilus assembly protein TadG-related protein n=1 Tax=Vibrio mediterranei TaxID=689 RepID=UPI0040696D94